MASRFSELIVKITGNAQGFKGVMAEVNRDLSVGLNQAQRTTRGFQQFGSALSSVGRSLAVGFSLPLIGGAAASVKFAADLEALKLGLQAVSGSASEAERQFSDLREVAKLPGLGLEEAVRGATNLQAVGFSAAKSKEILLQFGNALATVGKGREDLDAVILQLGQMAAAGTVLQKDLRPVIERVPQLAAIIKEKFGPEAIGDPAKVLQNLGISSAQFIDIILTELGKAPRVTGGLKNDFENLSDSIKLAMAEAGSALAPFAKSLVDDFAVPAIAALGNTAKAFKDLPSAVKAAVVEITALLAIGPLATIFAGSMVRALTEIKLAMSAAGIQAGLFSIAIRGIEITAVAGSILYLANAFWELKKAEEGRDQAVAWELTAINDLIRRAKAAADGNKEQLATIERLVSEYNRLQITGDQLRRSLVALVGAHAQITQSAPAAAAATEELTAAFTNGVRGATLESKVLAAELAILQQKSGEFVQQLAEVRLGLRIFTDNDLPPKIDNATAAVDAFSIELDDIPGQADVIKKSFEEATRSINQGFMDLIQNGLIAVGAHTNDLSAIFKKFGFEARATMQKVGDSAKEFLDRQVSTIVSDLGQQLADLAFEGGKLKDRLSDAFESIGKAILRAAIEAQLKRIAKLVVDLAQNVPALGKVLSAVFGVGASAAQGAAGAAGAAGSAAGAGGSIAGGIGSAVGGGITGAVTAGASVVSAISGVIGNFQSAHMNTALGRIEESTRYTKIMVQEILERGVNQFLSFLPSIHDRLMTVVDRGIGIYNAPGYELRIAGIGAQGSAGAAGGITFNIYDATDPKAVAQAVVTYLKDRGVIPNG